MGFWHGPEIDQKVSTPFLGLGWPDRAPLAWSAAFAVLFLLSYELNRWIDPLVSLVDQRVSLVFLPAFIRVVSVLVAGVAGALGIFVGALAVGLLNGDTLATAGAHAAISALSPCLAVYVLRAALRKSHLPLDAFTLTSMAAFSSLFGAALHGAFWAEFEPETLFLGVDTVALMMLGDLLGVLLGFLVLRLFVLTLKSIRSQNRV